MKKLFSILVLALAALSCNKDAENVTVPPYPYAFAGNVFDTFVIRKTRFRVTGELNRNVLIFKELKMHITQWEIEKGLIIH